MTRIRRIFGIAAIGLAVTVAGPAIAQATNGQANQTPPATQSAQDFSSQQLQQFASALTDVVDLREQAQQKMQSTEDKDAQSQIVQQARSQMLEAIKDAGLTLDDYNQIAQAARSNPDLAQKIQQMQ